MIGVKVKDSEIWLPRFLNQLEHINYDFSRVIFLYADSHDRSFTLLNHYCKTSKHKIEIYHEPYLPFGERHNYSLAQLKRDFQNLLQKGTEEYFLTLDCDVVKIPPDLITKLIDDNLDVVAPMVWTENRPVKTFFDTYMFRKDGCRFHPLYPPGLTEHEPFTCDSVGNTCALRTRKAELAGVYKNPYPNFHYCKSLIDKGFQVWVDPRLSVDHIDLEYYKIMHYPLPIPASNVPLITNKGEKVPVAQGLAQQHYVDRESYDAWFRQTYPEDADGIDKWWGSRPLITAAYKVFNEGKFLKYSLDSIYQYVDRIDIIEGAMVSTMHLSGEGGSSTDDTLDIIKTYPDPQHKIRLIQGKWRNREEMQQRLLEICQSQWMLFIDGDEILPPKSMHIVRKFCSEHHDGKTVYARPERFFNMWHDFHHIAYSLNPIGPWAQYGLPHAFLIWTDIPGLNFAQYHTIPHDGFGVPVSLDHPSYRGKQAVLDGVFVYHFGNAKGEEAMQQKFATGHPRSFGKEDKLVDDPWYSGEMPADMVLEDFDAWQLPRLLKRHPDYGKCRIRITERNPYKFEVLL